MIKEKRLAMNLTQQEMAEELGISLRQYVRIDNEEDLPRRDVLQHLISLLDLSNEELGIYIREISTKWAWLNILVFRIFTMLLFKS